MLNYIALVIPLLLLLAGIEWYISIRRKDRVFTTPNVMQNLAIGAVDQFGSLVYFTALYFVLNFVSRHFSLFHMANGWKQWVLAYLTIDFISYWYHRFSHEVNILWAGHVTHHSSEHFNLSNGFRTSLFQGFNRIVFWAILPVFGFSPWVLLVTLKVSGLYDFFLHTAYIPKLGILEKILITPSMHRVHHGKNDLYIDKNYGSTLVIWDKLFGTFQEETEPVKYGIRAEYKDNHPLKAIGHHYQYLWLHMKAIPGLADKLQLLVRRPGWLPNHCQPLSQLTKAGHSGHHLRSLGWFRVACVVPSFVAFMYYTPLLSMPETVLLGVVLAGDLIGVSLIFHHNLPSRFEKKEQWRLFLCTSAATAIFFRYHHMYLLLLAAYLCLSHLLLKQEYKMAELLKRMV